MALRVTLAGRVGIEVDDGEVAAAGLGRPGRLALAYLTCERHRAVPRDELAEVLWGDERPQSWDQEVIRAQVREAGIELRIENAPFSVIGPQLLRGDFDIEIFNYGKTLQGTVNQFRPGNRWAYPNPRPDELIQQTTSELDDTRRLQLLHEADRLLWDDLPIVPLFQVPLYLAVRDTFVNVAQNVGNPASIFWNAPQWGRKA